MGKNCIRIYMNPSEVLAFKNTASKEGKPVSVMGAMVLRMFLNNRFYDEIDSRIRFEERLNDMLTKINGSLTKTLRSSEQLLARSGVYSKAVWEIEKVKIPATFQRDLIKKCASSLMDPFEKSLGVVENVIKPPDDVISQSSKPKIDFGDD
ncbi:MAG: hypothetical protein L6408_03070 [Nanoarchaeota archaeon]|nr:hypothetical protein [Nanoarchaeota archaeon]